MKNRKHIYFVFLLMATVSALSQTATSATAPANAPQQMQGKVAGAAQQRDGGRVFEQNCSRCHNPPEGFSPRISGTIARHMRVRAGLSKEDEQAILRFLKP
jgi:cytochrome c5